MERIPPSSAWQSCRLSRSVPIRQRYDRDHDPDQHGYQRRGRADGSYGFDVMVVSPWPPPRRWKYVHVRISQVKTSLVSGHREGKGGGNWPTEIREAVKSKSEGCQRKIHRHGRATAQCRGAMYGRIGRTGRGRRNSIVGLTIGRQMGAASGEDPWQGLSGKVMASDGGPRVELV